MTTDLVAFFISAHRKKITVLFPSFVSFFFLHFFLPWSPPSHSLPPSRSLPAKSANSHADLSLDRWLQAKNVYLHTASNKTSRCLQSRRSSPITMTPNQARQEEETAEQPTGGRGEIVQCLNRGRRVGFFFLLQIYTLTVGGKPDFIWFVLPFHLSLFVFLIFFPLRLELFSCL